MEIKKSRLRRAKRDLWGVRLRIDTRLSGTAIGVLATESIEKRILSTAAITLDNLEYVCLINVVTGKASFLHYDDIVRVRIIK